MVEYIVAIDVTRVRFPADAFMCEGPGSCSAALDVVVSFPHDSLMDTLGIEPRASRMLSGCDTTTPRALEDLESASCTH